MSYPRREDQRVKFWSTRIDYTVGQLKPLFAASETLADQYYNEPATAREASAGGPMSQDEVTARTKSGIVYGYIDQSLSNMLDREPVFQSFAEDRRASLPVDPSDPQSLNMAQGQSKIVNYRYRETNHLRVDERVALSAFLFPYGVAKLGYTQDMERARHELLQPGVGAELVFEDPLEENLFLAVGEVTRVEEDQDHRHHIDVHTQILQGGLLGMSEDIASAVEGVVQSHVDLHKAFLDRKSPDPNTNVQHESPFGIWWPSDQFITDLMSMEGPQDARWCAFGWELPLEEVQGDPNFENTKDLRPSRWLDSPSKEDGADYDGFDMVRGWELWAKNFPVGQGKYRDIVLNIAEGSEKFLNYEEEWPYDRIDDYPVETLSFTPGLRRWFHKPTILLGGGDTVQALVNEVLDANLSVIRKQKNIWVVDPASGLNTEKIQQLINAPDGSVIEVPGLMDSSIGKAIMPLPFHEVPPEKGEMLNTLMAMFDRALGTPQPGRTPNPDSATEANIIEKRNTSRENRKSSLISEFQVRKARKMWQMDAQFRPKKLFNVDKNADKFLSISADMAKGEYLMTMDITSHATSLAVERSQWMDLLKLFSGMTPMFVEIWGLPPNLPELARRLLVRGFDEQLVEEILPMIKAATAMLEEKRLLEFDEQGNPIVRDPRLQELVQESRTTGRGEGGIKPDSMNRDVPNEGRQSGEVLRG